LRAKTEYTKSGSYLMLPETKKLMSKLKQKFPNYRLYQLVNIALWLFARCMEGGNFKFEKLTNHDDIEEKWKIDMK